MEEEQYSINKTQAFGSSRLFMVILQALFTGVWLLPEFWNSCVKGCPTSLKWKLLNIYVLFGPIFNGKSTIFGDRGTPIS